MERTIIKTEKKSIKEVVIENRGKIIAGCGILAVSALSYIVYKGKINYKRLEDSLDVAHGKADILAEALSEGVFEEALATTTRKLNSRKDKLNYILENYDEVSDTVIKLKGEIKVLTRRRDAFTRAQEVLGIGDE